MPRQRDYKAEYAKRVRRAREEGYKGYGQKRYRQHKALVSGIPAYGWADDITKDMVPFEEHTYYQKRALRQLDDYGLNRTEIDPLKDLRGADFWKQARPLLERESELAKGH